MGNEEMLQMDGDPITGWGYGNATKANGSPKVVEKVSSNRSGYFQKYYEKNREKLLSDMSARRLAKLGKLVARPYRKKAANNAV